MNGLQIITRMIDVTAENAVWTIHAVPIALALDIKSYVTVAGSKYRLQLLVMEANGKIQNETDSTATIAAWVAANPTS